MTIEELKELVQGVATKFVPEAFVVGEAGDDVETGDKYFAVHIYWNGEPKDTVDLTGPAPPAAPRSSLMVGVDDLEKGLEAARHDVERHFQHSVERSFKSWKAKEPS